MKEQIESSRPLYYRDGRRFVKLGFSTTLDYVGLFYNKDGTFSKERYPSLSIGRVLFRDDDDLVIAALENLPCILPFYHGKRLCMEEFGGKGYMPTEWEMWRALLSTYRYVIFPTKDYIWIDSSVAEKSEFSRCVHTKSIAITEGAAMCLESKLYDKLGMHIVRPFCRVNIKDFRYGERY